MVLTEQSALHREREILLLLGTLEETVMGVDRTLRVELGIRLVRGILGGIQEHAGSTKRRHAAALTTGAACLVTAGPMTVGPMTATTCLAGDHTGEFRKRGIKRTHLGLDAGRGIQQIVGTTGSDIGGFTTTLGEGFAVHGQSRTAGETTTLLTAMRLTAAVFTGVVLTTTTAMFTGSHFYHG
jgi:hypothetical protein